MSPPRNALTPWTNGDERGNRRGQRKSTNEGGEGESDKAAQYLYDAGAAFLDRGQAFWLKTRLDKHVHQHFVF